MERGMWASIRAIGSYFPTATLSNADLAAEFPEWSAEKILGKTGIENRHISGPDEYTSDLAVSATRNLASSCDCNFEKVEFVILCTQSPDFLLPTTACIVQDRLGLPTSIGALDINLGCSGYVYSLGIARGLIETRQAQAVLLITADVYTKHLDPEDRTTRTLFGDAATATLLHGKDRFGDDGDPSPLIGPFVFGTDGSGARNLITHAGGMRTAAANVSNHVEHEPLRDTGRLYMNGPEIFTFTLREVPRTVHDALKKAELGMEDIDLFVFHQANEFILQHLRRQLGIPSERFHIAMANCGNTVSSSIPIALQDAQLAGKLLPGHRVLVVGFGVGYSWAGAVLRWNPD